MNCMASQFPVTHTHLIAIYSYHICISVVRTVCMHLVPVKVGISVSIKVGFSVSIGFQICIYTYLELLACTHMY